MPESCASHHILPVKHLQYVTEQLAASLQILALLQVELQLVRHQRQEDLTAICRDPEENTHSLQRSTHGTDERSPTAAQHMLKTNIADAHSLIMTLTSKD